MDISKNSYNSDITSLYNSLKSEENSRNTILSIMQKFAESNDDIDINSVDNVKNFLDNLKSSLDLCNQNIDTLKRILKEVDEISIMPESVEAPKPSEQTEPEIIPTNSKVEQQVGFTPVENTLIISEVHQNVILPYKLIEINNYLEDKPDYYSSIKDVVYKKYTLPLKQFKNPFISRFRESFRLIRNKEKGAIRDAFDLGIELMFNYNLHPAIISACKNLDELDIYLDYLESGETNKFDIFNVVFEMMPTVVKKKHQF